MDAYLGEIRMFAGNFAPKDWAFCNGALLPISQNTALFSILGTTYGGDGGTNFALPDLQGRAPMHQGQGPGLSGRILGEVGGTSVVTLQVSEMPAHNHVPNCQSINTGVADPTNAIWTATTGRFKSPAYSTTPNQAMSTQAIGVAGSSIPHKNMQPYQGMNFIIALQGVFPPRP
jgi:microcystin-dependent protein